MEPITYLIVYGIFVLLWVVAGLLIARAMPRTNNDYGVEHAGPEYKRDERIMLTCRDCGCKFQAKLSSSDRCFECYIKSV